MDSTIIPDTLEYSWTGEVKLNNGQVMTIWYTCWPSIKSIVSEVIWLASDYPKHKINKTCMCE